MGFYLCILFYIQLQLFIYNLYRTNQINYLLGQEVNTNCVFATLGPELNLGKDLIGKGVAHYKTGVTHGTSQVHKSPFSQYNNMASILQEVTVNLLREKRRMMRESKVN